MTTSTDREAGSASAPATNAIPSPSSSTAEGSGSAYPLLANKAQCCRICLDDDPHGLYSPCRCRGSIKFVHSHCLTRWYVCRSLNKSVEELMYTESGVRATLLTEQPSKNEKRDQCRNVFLSPCDTTSSSTNAKHRATEKARPIGDQRQPDQCIIHKPHMQNIHPNRTLERREANQRPRQAITAEGARR